ncbi:unnamed protein product [Cylindrotheca closterium]|uniref:Uncharacterized protein n=1 Tax=Cylindrotheca closterium TaxID=2856 RepID=A0AAD2CI41_9STRA|nr:unnamed protein product [Cylindrotheca closterium]
MTTTDNKGDNKQRSRKARDSQKEDAKAKERGRRRQNKKDPSTTVSPGVESGKDGEALDKSSRSRGQRRNHQEDRQAKDKARTSGRSGSSSRPGVSHETNSSGDLARKKSSGTSTSSRRYSPDRNGETIIGSPRTRSSPRSGRKKGDDKKNGHSNRHRNRGSSIPGVQAEINDRDRASRKEARQSSNTRGVGLDGTIAPNKDDKYAVHASIVGEEEFNEGQRNEDEEARISKRIQEEATRLRDEEKRQENERKKLEAEQKRKKRRNLVILVVILLLIGIGVGAYFGTQGISSTNSVDNGQAAVVNPADDTTSQSPSADLTAATTNPPSRIFRQIWKIASA